jgi:hypothetical protein
MAQRCQVCIHPNVVQIHESILAGTPRRRVARAFGIEHTAMDRHWKNHMPAQMKGAAARAEDAAGPERIDVVNGDVLLGLAAAQYERSKDMLDGLELRMSQPMAVIDVRAVVASLREVRQAIETLAKLSFAVEDRPARPAASEHLSIDAAIIKALEERQIKVEERTAPQERTPRTGPPLELLPGPVEADVA